MAKDDVVAALEEYEYHERLRLAVGAPVQPVQLPDGTVVEVSPEAAHELLLRQAMRQSAGDTKRTESLPSARRSVVVRPHNGRAMRGGSPIDVRGQIDTFGRPESLGNVRLEAKADASARKDAARTEQARADEVATAKRVAAAMRRYRR